MTLDIRIPLGLMFAVLGVLLTVWGLYTSNNADMYARSLGVNVNLFWGVGLLAFGVIMLLFSQWKSAPAASTPSQPAPETAASGSSQPAPETGAEPKV